MPRDSSRDQGREPFTALGTIHCPVLVARITRQECYERQSRQAAVVGKTEVFSIRDGSRDKYCRSGECGLGAFIARAFQRGQLTYEPKRPAPVGAKRGSLRPTRQKKR